MDKRKADDTPRMKPYDELIWEHWSMYDAMPYVWDPDLNVEKVFQFNSGNIIKAYRFQLDEPYEIKHD